MTTTPENLSEINLAQNQAMEYAKDFSKLYASEKKKIQALEIANFQLKHFSKSLNSQVEELYGKNQELNEAFLGTLSCLSMAADLKDEETGTHLNRMSRYSEVVAKSLGLDEQMSTRILQAAPMHDIGKIGVPDTILLKPGKLSKMEFSEIRKHTIMGAKILTGTNAPIVTVARRIAISHHEKWNGKGYPSGLSKNQIPIEARIVAIADVFDALTTRRPYKDPYPVPIACDLINLEREKTFDPEIADAFFDCLDKIIAIKKHVEGISTNESERFSWSERDIINN
jgi:putative two-component system response regulator